MYGFQNDMEMNYHSYKNKRAPTTADRNPLEEMEWPSWSTKESEMQYLDAISKTTE